MTEGGSELRFDRAAYSDDAKTAAPCSSCKSPVGDSYWTWQTHVVCAKCRDKIAAMLAASQSPARLGKALLMGGATALACGAGYAIFVAVTNFQFALVTIGMAFLIARAVRQASGGIGGTKFQILAVALTYLAATMGYIPGIWNGLKEASSKQEAKDSSASAPSSAKATDTSAPPKAPSVGGLVLAVGWLIGIMLAAPFLEFTDAPIGLLIVAFGLWEAWKLSRGPPAVLQGPFQVAAQAAGAPPA